MANNLWLEPKCWSSSCSPSVSPYLVFPDDYCDFMSSVNTQGLGNGQIFFSPSGNVLSSQLWFSPALSSCYTLFWHCPLPPHASWRQTLLPANWWNQNRSTWGTLVALLLLNPFNPSRTTQTGTTPLPWTSTGRETPRSLSATTGISCLENSTQFWRPQIHFPNIRAFLSATGRILFPIWGLLKLRLFSVKS